MEKIGVFNMGLKRTAKSSTDFGCRALSAQAVLNFWLSVSIYRLWSPNLRLFQNELEPSTLSPEPYALQFFIDCSRSATRESQL